MKVRFGFMNTPRAELIAVLQQTQPELERLTASISDVELDFYPTSEDWSIREILAHLVDDEMYVMRTRFERMMKEDRPDLAPHDEKYWYANRNKTRDRLEELLSDFAIQRAASLAMINMLRESDCTREGYQPEYGHFTAEQWLASWAEHDTVHLRQIERNLQSARLSPHKS
jgi:DinB superfamily